ncbi:MAG: hypothetical protein QOG82_123 [Actinomycetota bacterium]|nr:hypothetical protein [Actinomycetota bacterium]
MVVMRSMEEDSSLRRALDHVPRPLRVAATLVLTATVVYDRFVVGPDRHSPVWVLVVEAVGGVVLAAFGLILVAHTFNEPDRRPLADGRFWLAYLMITGSCLVLGPWSFFDGDPQTSPAIGGTMFVVGLVLAGLFARHVVKPVRAGERRPRNMWSGYDLERPAEREIGAPEGPSVTQWHAAARRANDGRARRGNPNPSTLAPDDDAPPPGNRRR